MSAILAVGGAGCAAPAPASEEATATNPPPQPSARPSGLPDTATPGPALTALAPSPSPFATRISTPTDVKGEVIQFAVEECELTFCPPPWLDQQVKKLLSEHPGIIDAQALDELSVRILYDPALLTEEEVIQLFEKETELTAVAD